jgi:uncharacterized protein with PIN domain
VIQRWYLFSARGDDPGKEKNGNLIGKYCQMAEKNSHKKVFIRFYAELNDFLPVHLRQKQVEYCFNGLITVRDAVESMGVPLSAVDLILVNGEPCGFRTRLRPDDRVSVYPEFEMLDISGLTRLRNNPLRITRFIADAHLGKLARQLRMLGFDTLFSGTLPDEKIIQVSAEEKRIILTRDRELLKSDKVDHGYYVRATVTDDQLIEVIFKFDLTHQFRPFTRCLVCNGLLEDFPKDELPSGLPAELIAMHKEFFRCSACGKVYWEGSHYNRMSEKINKLSGSFKQKF